ncbi:Universal stress protein A [Desulfonema limicola]|uniref:Universal stress protein n=1 Tax=Desulfonema limicola TaxID=45656 RepID=A0A975B3Q4_9BACT|nr:universal stress protein [Desulfonema limicola]QTA78211.1 Universal stress protein A [Desulfonema limicola]
MKEFKKILFPVDLSDTSVKIVPYVETMAEKFDSRVHLLFVARAFQYFNAIYVPNTSIHNLENQIIDGAKIRLKEFQEEHFKNYSNIKIHVAAGDISEEILNYIQSEKIDMLIMGTHGRKGLEKVFFGSVAERVAKISTVPVLLINPYRHGLEV